MINIYILYMFLIYIFKIRIGSQGCDTIPISPHRNNYDKNAPGQDTYYNSFISEVANGGNSGTDYILFV
jgi:hypothetical protein